jgi:hypothetical protein
MEQGSIDENIRRFTQANHTPSLQKEKYQLLGCTGNTVMSNDLSKGIIDQRLHPGIRELAPYLKIPKRNISNKKTIFMLSSDDYIQAWKHCQEFTSSGQSTLHFGHFKPSCLHINTLDVERILAEISLRRGYSLNRLKSAINSMIPKKRDGLRVDKLRTIVSMKWTSIL